MGVLFDQLVSFPNLWLAVQKANRGKRSRPNVARFGLRLEEELIALQHELGERIYQPGAYRQFHIHDKKTRLISAAPFRDRVVHHALCQIIEPIFEQGFLYDSYACRKGKGSHAAVERASYYARRYRYVLKCDLQTFFPSIDHEVLLVILRRRIWDEGVLWLIQVILKNGGGESGEAWYFPGDKLFSPAERTRGLPIGNQTSQFLGNVHLDPLDHFVKEHLHVPGYIRYVDDFLVFANEKSQLHHIHAAIQEFCDGLRVRLHTRKSFVTPVRTGVTFLGHRIFPGYRRLDPTNVKRFRRRLQRYNLAVHHGDLAVKDARACVASWEAHARHAKTRRLRERIFQTVPWVDSPGI